MGTDPSLPKGKVVGTDPSLPVGTDPSLPKSLGACRERKRSVREGQTLSVGRPKPPCGESADPVSPPPGKPPRGQSVAGTVPRASVPELV